MRQLELFDDLEPVQTWLHVWNEAEREHRLNQKKAPARQAVDHAGAKPRLPVAREGQMGRQAACQRIRLRIPEEDVRK